MEQSVQVLQLGLTTYEDALAIQRRLHGLRVAGEIGDLLLLTEHEACPDTRAGGGRAEFTCES